MKNEMRFAEFVCGNIKNRNKIFDVSIYKHEDTSESYRSMFLFDERLNEWVSRTGSVAGYAASMTAESLILDFDALDPEEARKEVILFTKKTECGI